MDEDVGNIEEMSIDPPNSMEIEASVLCDMNDWLKQREKATADERYVILVCDRDPCITFDSIQFTRRSL